MLASCGPTAGGGARSKAPPTPAQRERPAQAAFERLKSALAAVPDQGNVLDALTPALRRAAQGIVDRLTAEERSELLRAGSATATAHPMFFLLAGGDAPSALDGLGSRGKGTGDLAALAQSAGITDKAQLLPIARELTHRAAARFLRTTATKLTKAADVDLELCDAIDRAGQVLKLPQLSERALELSLVLEPSADRWLRVVDMAARDSTSRRRARRSSTCARARGSKATGWLGSPLARSS